MATAHLTLEEAAARLDITPEDFKRRLKTDPLFKDLDRGKIRDGTSFRFKESAVEELGRELGAGSNPENPIPSFDHDPELDSSDFRVAPDPGTDEPLPLAADEPDGDVFSLSPDEPKAAGPKSGKITKSDSDSDVRLDGGKPSKKKGKGEEAIPTEEISIDFAGPGSAVIKGGSSSKLSAPKSSGKLTSDSGKSLAKPSPGTGDSSEFELSLDADSDDFELKLNTDTSDEVALGEMPKDAPGGSGRRAGESGILSRKPNDSGVSLEKGKGSGKGKAAPPPAKEDSSSDSDVDFELTLDSSAAVSGTKLGGLKGKKIDTGSDSEFELTLDDSGDSGLEHAALGGDASEAGKGDIFETDFEIPPMEESGSEAVALESSDTDLEKSDIDVSLDDSDSEVTADDSESGSEVVLLEDEEETAPVAKKGKGKPGKAKKVADVEDEGDVDLADVEETEDDESAAGALKGARAKRADEEDEEEAAAVPAGAYRPVPWGVVPALFLFPALILTLVGGLMAYELLQTMWGYQQPRKPAAPLTREIAKALDMELKDQ